MNKALIPALQAFRKELHRTPELSGEEKETAGRIHSFLREQGITEIIEGIGGYGLAAVIRGSSPGPDLMFRAELDALPIKEEPYISHYSRNPGVSHKCGHEGHMAILCGVAASLKGRRILQGRLILLFQPAEETGSGAAGVTSDKQFAPLIPDFVFALHNWPGFPRGDVVLKSGTIFAASTGVSVKLVGESAHASAPEEGVSPMDGLIRIQEQLKDLHHPDKSSKNFSLITTVGIEAGKGDFGISPGKASLYLTLRAYEEEILETLIADLEKGIERIAQEESLQWNIEFSDPFSGVTNSPSCVEKIKKAAESLSLPVHQLARGIASSEDVGRIFATARQGGAVFLLGNGENSPCLHSGEYDFDDTLIEPGVGMFLEILKDTLGLE